MPDRLADDRLTPRQRDVLAFIRTSVTDHGYAPSFREIGDAVGLSSSSSVRHQLRALERKGFLQRGASQPRAISITDTAAHACSVASEFPMRIEQFAMWLAVGERGISSEVIVTQLTGVRFRGGGWDWCYPLDAGDWRRCELLLREVPEARQHLGAMNGAPEWVALVGAWNELVSLGEAAPGFFKRYRHAPALQARVEELLEGAK